MGLKVISRKEIKNYNSFKKLFEQEYNISFDTFVESIKMNEKVKVIENPKEKDINEELAKSILDEQTQEFNPHYAKTK